MPSDRFRRDIANRVSGNIARRREILGLTQTDLADRVGVAQAQISRWELGQMPRLDILIRLAEALEMTVPDFYAPLDDEPGSNGEPEQVVA